MKIMEAAKYPADLCFGVCDNIKDTWKQGI